MNFYVNFNSQLEFDGSIWVWNYSKFPPRKIKLQITLIKNKGINYSRDGSTLRIDQVKDTSNGNQIYTNLEQIQFLQWSGEFGKNNQKIGRWTATWKEDTLKNVGGEYSEEGEKQGLWNELIKSFCDQAEVYAVGQYMNGQKQAIWKYLYNDKEIGGGSYDAGIKKGRWIQLSDDFFQKSQVTYNGEFKNGKKVGRWDIFFKGQYQKQYQKIGGGYYEEGTGSAKMRRWIELQDGFNNYSQVIYNGEFQNGKKVGIWSIFYKKYDEIEFKQLQYNHLYKSFSGCGSYSNGNKTGMWIELQNGFDHYSQVTYKGIYKNGKKVSRWDILYRQYDEKEFQQIGGGLYTEEGNGIKIGRWIQLDEEFRYNSQLTYHGEYKNDKKFGNWDSFYRKHDESTFKLIGGGSYDEDGIKIGRWVELNDGFNYYQQISSIGQYKNGKRVGKWDILYRKDDQREFEQIGGGSYGKEGDGIRNGIWTELSNEFQKDYQTTYYGQYLKGNKIGRWNILFRRLDEKIFKQIGGGSYDERGNGIKTGRWIELTDRYDNYSSVTYDGLYKQGKKVGIWVKQGLIYGHQIYKEMIYDI
ncbi:unnamed protein product [Paramecium sonneborni]|uniref:Uncharacterized protein n=1 Tax=Paramecium sonneborni TaxID=65129 RepID=A0A8S1QVB7_9CILI|nr:unnamed protein product [Paramecium sonneborni]